MYILNRLNVDIFGDSPNKMLMMINHYINYLVYREPDCEKTKHCFPSAYGTLGVKVKDLYWVDADFPTWKKEGRKSAFINACFPPRTELDMSPLSIKTDYSRNPSLLSCAEQMAEIMADTKVFDSLTAAVDNIYVTGGVFDFPASAITKINSSLIAETSERGKGR